MRYLTSLRGIAAFLIVLYHIKYHLTPYLPDWMMNIVSHSYVAVDFFFVLSGFILAYTYEKKLTSFNLNETSFFIVKRIARVYPLHLITLLAYLLIPFAHIMTGRAYDNEERYAVDNFFYNIFLVQNWGLTGQGGWNVPSWSISTELFAYLSLPLLTLFLTRISLMGRFIFTLILCSFTSLLFEVKEANNIGEFIADLGIIRCITAFYVGNFVYSLSKQHKPSLLVKSVCLGFVFIILISPIKSFYVVPALFGALLYLLITSNSILHNALENKTLIYLGDISYSVYMVHYLIRDYMGLLFLDNEEYASITWILVYISTTIILSHFTYKYVEIFFRQRITEKYQPIYTRNR